MGKYKFGIDLLQELLDSKIVKKFSDFENMSQEDLLAAKALRDRELLEAEARVSNIKKDTALKNEKLNIEPEVDIFADEIVQTGPSQETLDNPFFGSFYKDNIDLI